MIFVFAVITNEIRVYVIFRLDVTFVKQRTPWLRIDDEVFPVILKLTSRAIFVLAVITNEIGVYVIFRLDVTFVIQRIPWLRIDDFVNLDVTLTLELRITAVVHFM